LPQNTASTDFATPKPALPLGFERLTQKRTAGAIGGLVGGVIENIVPEGSIAKSGLAGMPGK
jgi:hypothetical protein